MPNEYQTDWKHIENYALEKLGFSSIAVSDTNLSNYIPNYQAWIKANYHGDMTYMTTHGNKRFIPEMLVSDTQSVIMVTLNYLTQAIDFKHIKKNLSECSEKAVISHYALGRDYHKVIRKKLQKLGHFITTLYPHHQFRAFTDSAPVLEKPLAEKASLGVIAKNSNLLNQEGSFFFLGALYSNLPFDPTTLSKIKSKDLCRKCTACIQICPTQAILPGKKIDARRCISYLTIENKGPIPLEFRKAIGTRIYGCDDCQLICPWNRFAQLTQEQDFLPRDQLKNPNLTDLMDWNETQFLKHTEGSAIRRIGHSNWQRNIAIAMGNAPHSKTIQASLELALENTTSEIVKEAILWALDEQALKSQR